MYFADLEGFSILRYDYYENRIYEARVLNATERVSSILPIEGLKDKFAVSVGRNIKIVKWDGKSSEAKVVCTQLEMDQNIPTNVLHDIKADPRGGFFGETIRKVLCNPNVNTPPGSIWRSNHGEAPISIAGDMNTPNGFEFDIKKYVYYLTESCLNQIIGYNWNRKTGEICMYINIFIYKFKFAI